MDKYLSTPDFTALGYVANRSVLPTKLSLINCNMNIDAIDAVLSELERHSLQELHIVMDSTQVGCIRKLLANLGTLKSIFIETKFKELATELPQDVEYQLNNVTKLSLINTDISQLMDLGAINFTTLTILNLKDSTLGTSGVQALFHGLKHSERAKYTKRQNR